MGGLQCPACGANNDCAVVREGDSAQCWCMDRHWPTLATPKASVVATCLCRSCLQAQVVDGERATARE